MPGTALVAEPHAERPAIVSGYVQATGKASKQRVDVDRNQEREQQSPVAHESDDKCSEDGRDLPSDAQERLNPVSDDRLTGGPSGTLHTSVRHRESGT